MEFCNFNAFASTPDLANKMPAVDGEAEVELEVEVAVAVEGS